MGVGIGASLTTLSNGTIANAPDVLGDLNNINNGGVSNDGGAISTNGSGVMTTLGNVVNGLLSMGGSFNGGFPSAQTLTNNSAIILPTAGPIKVVTCSSSVTGITMPNGVNAGDIYLIVNTAGTGFAVSFTGSNIRDVGNVAIQAGHFALFIWSGPGGAWLTRV